MLYYKVTGDGSSRHMCVQLRGQLCPIAEGYSIFVPRLELQALQLPNTLSLLQWFKGAWTDGYMHIIHAVGLPI